MKVALYVRVSTEEQAQLGYSIQAQVKTLTEYCSAKNWSVFEIYKDEGLSGKNLNRPNLQRMLEDADSRLFDMVLVWKLSRLSRKQSELLTLIDNLERKDISFASVSESFDVSTPMGKAMMGILAAFAELERNQIVENVKLGMNQRAKQGLWNGGSVLGYKSENKRLIVEQKEANIVREIFSLYTSGYGYKAITNRLNHSGYRTKRNKPFSIVSVRNVVTNPVYAGYVRFNKYENWSDKGRKGKSQPLLEKGVHEPIIDEDTWRKAQDSNENRSKKPTKTFTGHFPLTTLLRCPQCGHGMIGHKNKSKNQTEYRRYYQCGNFHSKGSAVCSTNAVRADRIEEEVFTRLESVLSYSTLLDSIVENLNSKISEQKQPLIKNLKYVNGQISSIQDRLNKYLGSFESGRMPPKTAFERMDALEKELAEYEAQKKELESLLARPSVTEISSGKVREALAFFGEVVPKASAEKQKALLHTLINKITVVKADKIDDRHVKDIELFFDLRGTEPNERVLTYDTVHRSATKHTLNFDHRVYILI